MWAGPGRRVGSELRAVRSVEAKLAGCPGDCPPSFVNEDVVVSAEEDEIVDPGVTSVGPMGEMVDIAPVRGSVTTGKHASQVPGTNRSPEGGGDQTSRPTDIEGL